MIRYLFWIGFVFLLSEGKAQIVNIERARIFDDSLGWSGAIDAGLNAIQNDKLLLTSFLRPKVQYKNKKHYYLFLTDWSYSLAGEEIFSNYGMAHFRYAYRIKMSPLKWESYTQIQYNQLLDQKSRSLVGTGLRMKFYDKDKVRIFAGTSTLFEYEELQKSRQFNSNLRWSNYFSWYIQKGIVSFTGISYMQPNFENFNDFRYLGQYTLLFKVLKKVDIKMEVNTTYDAFPPPNVKTWTFFGHFGVKVSIKD